MVRQPGDVFLVGLPVADRGFRQVLPVFRDGRGKLTFVRARCSRHKRQSRLVAVCFCSLVARLVSGETGLAVGRPVRRGTASDRFGVRPDPETPGDRDGTHVRGRAEHFRPYNVQQSGSGLENDQTHGDREQFPRATDYIFEKFQVRVFERLLAPVPCVNVL